MLTKLWLTIPNRKLITTGAVALGIIVAAIALSLAATKDRPPQPPVTKGADSPPAASPPDQLWAKACAKDQKGADICYVEQFAVAQPQNAVLLHVRIGHIGPEGKPRMIVAAPTGVLLPAGLTITLDQNKPIQLPFNTCDANGCVAVVDMDANALKQFTSGTVLMVRYLQGNNSPLDIPVQMAGLSAALANISTK